MRGSAWWATATFLLAVTALMPVQTSTADDPFPPEVSRILPDDGSNLNAGEWTVEVNFTEAMNLTSMENALTIDPQAQYHLWFWTLDNTTFFYRMWLEPGTYHFSLADTVQDVNGTEMDSTYSWSYSVSRDGSESSGPSIPIWVGFLPGTLPFVIILVAWYIYESRRKSRLSPHQLERLKEIQPKTFDTYTIVMLALFGAVLVLVVLHFVYEWFILFALIGILAPTVGLMAFIGFIYGVSSTSRARQRVEMEAFGYPPTSPKVVRKSERSHIAKIALIVITGFLAYFAFLVMMPMPGSSFDPYPLLFFAPMFAALIA
ncbi:MAG: Ig-like domain-containing protein, partial [Thermoplasmata archaeon]|nr:Ig-like domain-containing protein [Thermoplasmata archaeon]